MTASITRCITIQFIQANYSEFEQMTELHSLCVKMSVEGVGSKKRAMENKKKLNYKFLDTKLHYMCQDVLGTNNNMWLFVLGLSLPPSYGYCYQYTIDMEHNGVKLIFTLQMLADQFFPEHSAFHILTHAITMS